MKIRYAKLEDKEFWFSLDRHISVEEFERKAKLGQCYVICDGDNTAGILRYNLFWDNTPFCNLIYIDERFWRNGYGRRLMRNWEEEMKNLGYRCALTSTKAGERGRYFFNALGYKICGTMNLNGEGEELILSKNL